MTKYKYAFKTEREDIVKTVGRDVSLSPKMAIEMCKFVKGMPISKAKGILELVKEQKLAVPITRATNGVGHKKSTPAAGRYPFKGSVEFIKLLNQLEINAQNKGLNSNLTIIHACAQRASEPFHNGRKRRVHMKRSHIELAASEKVEQTVKKAKPAKAAPLKKENKEQKEHKKQE